MFILCSIEWVPNEHLGMVEHQEKIDADIERVSGDMIRVEILRARNLRSLVSPRIRATDFRKTHSTWSL